KAGLHEMERRGGVPRAGRPGQHGGAFLACHRGGMKKHVPAAEDDLGVTVVDEVDALIQLPADVADRERTSGPEADQDSRRALEDEPSTRDLLSRLLGPAAALPHDVDELARSGHGALDETDLRQGRRSGDDGWAKVRRQT